MADVTITRTCTECGKKVDITMTAAQAHELSNRRRGGGRYIQDILHTHPAALREMFLSGMCPDCWDRIFKPMEENDL